MKFVKWLSFVSNYNSESINQHARVSNGPLKVTQLIFFESASYENPLLGFAFKCSTCDQISAMRVVEVRTIIIVLMLIGKGGMERVTLRGQEK